MSRIVRTEQSKLRTAVTQVRTLQQRLAHHRYRTRQERADLAELVVVLTWLLERAGYPPARYVEVAGPVADPAAPTARAAHMPPRVGEMFCDRYQVAADQTVPLRVGDVVLSNWKRHRGRLYRITDTSSGVVWGRRISRYSGTVMDTTTPITWPVERLEPTTPDLAIPQGYPNEPLQR